MNKIVIPAILAATVLVAGVFAMMPVQKASTIHSSLAGGATGVALTAHATETNLDCEALATAAAAAAGASAAAASPGDVAAAAGFGALAGIACP